MKEFAGLSLLVFAIVISFAGCKDEPQKGGAITIINDTRASVNGNYKVLDSTGSWSLSVGESWSRSVDEDGAYSISFPHYYDRDDNGYYSGYHEGKTKSGSLSSGDNVTLYVSSYVPGLEPFADYVLFKNGNPVPVTVYSDSAHQNKIADIAANGKSPYLTNNLTYYNRNGETHLYLVYHLFGVVDFHYYYDFINDVNFAGETPLPDLNYLETVEKNKALTHDAYILVKNTSTFSLSLSSGANEIPPLGSAFPVLASGKTGTYRVNAGNASSYQFKQNTTSPVAVPSGLSSFSSGTLYVLRYGYVLSWDRGAYYNSSFTISVAGALSYVQMVGN